MDRTVVEQMSVAAASRSGDPGLLRLERGGGGGVVRCKHSGGSRCVCVRGGELCMGVCVCACGERDRQK